MTRLGSIVLAAALALSTSTLLFAQRTSQPQLAVVTASAPVFLEPDANRTPLRVLMPGAQVTVAGAAEAGWMKVEFDDPGLGRRVGYFQTKAIGPDPVWWTS